MTRPVTRSASQTQIPRGPGLNPASGSSGGPSGTAGNVAEPTDGDGADRGQSSREGSRGGPGRHETSRNALEVLANGQASTMAFLERLSLRLQALEESSRPGNLHTESNRQDQMNDGSERVRRAVQDVPVDPAPVDHEYQLRIRIRNRRFATVLNVETYRLRNRARSIPEDESGNLTRISNQLRPRMESVKFNGDPPLSVLPFLQQLSRMSNQSSISEGCLL